MTFFICNSSVLLLLFVYSSKTTHIYFMDRYFWPGIKHIASLVFFFLSDCSQCNRYGPRAQQISVHGCFTPFDWMCSSVCGDGTFCLSHRLFAAHGLPLVQRLLPDQGTEGRHWTVSAGCLWVGTGLKTKTRTAKNNLDSTCSLNTNIEKYWVQKVNF